MSVCCRDEPGFLSKVQVINSEQLYFSFRNIIYALMCKRCDVKYTGETGLSLWDRSANIWTTNPRRYWHWPPKTSQGDHQGRLDISVAAIRSCSSDERTRKTLEQGFIFLVGCLHPELKLANSAFFDVIYISTYNVCATFVSASAFYAQLSCLSPRAVLIASGAPG